MAYARSITRRRSTRPFSRRARPTRAWTRKRGRGGYNTPRRTYRRKSRRMSTRAILNKTSQKKRDVMLSFTNAQIDNPYSTTFTQGPAVIRFPVGQTDPTEFVFMWNATARPGENSTGQRGSKLDTSLRTSESIFAVGLKEKLTLETNNGTSWQWRRICFTSKSDFDQDDPDTSNYFRRTSNGMVRLMRTETGDNPWSDSLFDGARNVDWLSLLTAPLSSSHYTIKYDKLRTISSGNDSGKTITFSMWHSMRKNIVYEQEQEGEEMVDSSVSVTGRAGMGNYYIVDIFKKNGVNDDFSTLQVTPESTFYWHEK